MRVEVPPDETADIATQTAQMLESLGRCSNAPGSGKGRLLLATLYLVDMADYDAVRTRLWDAWVPAGTAPSPPACRWGRLASPGWRVEIAVQAAVAEQAGRKGNHVLALSKIFTNFLFADFFDLTD